MPCRTAPAWPEMPPPPTEASTSNRPSTFAVLKGCLIIVCRGSRGKYCSNGSPFTRILPLPCTSRTRATAFLRRPVPMEIACTATPLPPHFQLLRLLREVRMLRPAVDPQVFDQCPAKRILGQHAPHGVGDELLWLVLEHVPEGHGSKPAGVPRVTVDEVTLRFAPGQPHLGGVDDDDAVAGVDVRRELGLVFAPQERGHPCRQASQDDAVGIHKVPLPFEAFRARQVRLHRNLSSDKANVIVSCTA